MTNLSHLCSPSLRGVVTSRLRGAPCRSASISPISPARAFRFSRSLTSALSVPPPPRNSTAPRLRGVFSPNPKPETLSLFLCAKSAKSGIPKRPVMAPPQRRITPESDNVRHLPPPSRNNSGLSTFHSLQIAPSATHPSLPRPPRSASAYPLSSRPIQRLNENVISTSANSRSKSSGKGGNCPVISMARRAS